MFSKLSWITCKKVVKTEEASCLACWKSKDITAATAKSLQSCPTLCDPIDSSPPGSSVPGILQARSLEWVAISFSNAWKWKVKVKSLSRVIKHPLFLLGSFIPRKQFIFPLQHFPQIGLCFHSAIHLSPFVLIFKRIGFFQPHCHTSRWHW